MGRISGTKPMFDEEDVRRVVEPGLPRLIRVIFLGLGITNEEYLNRYHHYFREQNNPDKTPKEHSQKAAADRKFLLDPRKLTFNMMRNVLAAMRWDVECVSVRLRDRLTGDIQVFSTDDTVDELKARLQEKQEIGITSIE